MVLVGCSQPNPWFVLLSDGSTSDTSEGTSETGQGTSSTSAGATSVVSSGSETGVVASSGSETADTGTSIGESTSTSDGSSSTGSTGSTGTSGGPPEEELLYDLWEMCPQAVWNAEGFKNKELPCTVGAPPPSPWAGHLPVPYMLEMKVLAEVPYPGLGNVVIGKYSGLVLEGKNSPVMRAVLVCPAPGPCEIAAAVYAEVDGVNVVGAYQDAVLSTGEELQFEVDLSPINDGTPFAVVVTLESKSDAPSSHGLWLRPRIVAIQ